MELLPDYWKTERLYVRDAELEEDLDSLQALWESTAYLGEFDGRFERNQDDMYQDLTKGDLPPGGKREFFKVQPFFSKTSPEMIGYLTVYHGYPDNKTMWITFFYVEKSEQKKGYGKEVITTLSAEAKKAGFQRIALTVALKNWEAIRFWTNAGFDKITGVHGDETFADHHYANLSLEKRLIEEER